MAGLCWLHSRLRSCKREGHGGSLLASLYAELVKRGGGWRFHAAFTVG